jgi:hypothetical protein
MKILDDLIQEVFPPTLKFLSAECCTALLTDTGSQAASVNAAVSGVMEVATFLKVFSALLDKVVLREELEKKAQGDETVEGWLKSALFLLLYHFGWLKLALVLSL